MEKHNRSNRGVTLIELTVGILVGTIVVLGAGTLIIDSARSLKKTEFEMNNKLFVDTFKKGILGSGSSCKDHFAGARINLIDAAKTDGTSLSVLNVEQFGLNAGDELKEGTILKNFGLKIDKLQFSKASKLGEDVKGRNLYRGKIIAVVNSDLMNGLRSTYQPIGDVVFAVDDAGNLLDCAAATVEDAMGVCDPALGNLTCVQYFDAGSSVGCINPTLITGLVEDTDDTIFECGFDFSTACAPGEAVQQINGFAGAPGCKQFKATYEVNL